MTPKFEQHVSDTYDLFDLLFERTRPMEGWEFDEVVIPTLVLGIMCIWYAHRRSCDLRSESIAHEQTAAYLQTRERQYQTLVEGSIQGMYIHRDGTILFANSALARLFGYDDRETLLGLDVWQLVAQHERERLQGYARARLRSAAVPLRHEWQGVRRDGTHIWLDCLVTIVSWDEQPSIMAVVVDISEQKRLELRQQQIVYDMHDGIAQLMVSAQHHFDEADDLWLDDMALARHHLQRGSAQLNQAKRHKTTPDSATPREVGCSRTDSLHPALSRSSEGGAGLGGGIY